MFFRKNSKFDKAIKLYILIVYIKFNFRKKSKNRKINHVTLIFRKIYVKRNTRFSANLNIFNI